MLLTVYEHEEINVGKNRGNNQISEVDRDLLLNISIKLDEETNKFHFCKNKHEETNHKCKRIFEWHTKNLIRATSIVGSIKIDKELVIEILPKVFKFQEKNIARKNFNILVQISEYPDIRFEDINIEENIEDMPYLDFFVKKFTSNLLEELNRGIYSEYVEKIEKNSFVRGSIQPHLQDVFDKSKIVCKFKELSVNNNLMQIFKTVSDLLLRDSSFDFSIKKDLFEITTILNEVDGFDKLEEKDFDDFYFNRLNENFANIFFQAKAVYFKYLPVNNDDEENPFFAIFFDMDFLFEKFVSYLLSKSGFRVEEQKSLEIYKNHFITPDFILEKERIVIDSKYKKLQYKTIKGFPLNIFMFLSGFTWVNS